MPGDANCYDQESKEAFFVALRKKNDPIVEEVKTEENEFPE